jgi:hypothetical protein
MSKNVWKIKKKVFSDFTNKKLINEKFVFQKYGHLSQADMRSAMDHFASMGKSNDGKSGWGFDNNKLKMVVEDGAITFH